MTELVEDIEYILKNVQKGRKIALCCILFNDDGHRACERLYHLSHEMPLSNILGEIEMWKMDIRENTFLGGNEINSYTRRLGEIDV